MLSTVKEGLFAKVMGGGSVTPGTGDFNFAVEEAYLIKNGKIDRPVRGATLIGSGPDVLKKISMVGKNLELSPGMCGSVSGSIPVTVGQPALKVDEILAIYERISAPMLCVVASTDSLVQWWKDQYTLDEFKQRIAHVPKLEHAVIDDAGHMLHHDQPDVLARLLEKFLSD